ncbi:hypothetical protein E2C01_070795 [Portunus trituberculatus]|uniref:Uncharacterized protein n=1 Tax=Portunus trituberculatus TaxID=210409 RepID=A0A5B7I2K7_PORTR|nr:hypothetical protein [Portunus trituberculatus]
MNPPHHRLMKPCYCPEVGFTRSHSTQPEVLSQLLAFWNTMTRFHIHSVYCFVLLCSIGDSCRGIEIVETLAINLLTSVDPP